MNRKIVCIICPRSCEIETSDEKGQLEITGFGCVRGKRYAEAEVTCPVRTLTTTVRLQSGRMLPVRTDMPVPKEKLFECMKAINRLAPVPDEVKAGDVIMGNILDTGANLIASGNVGK